MREPCPPVCKLKLNKERAFAFVIANKVTLAPVGLSHLKAHRNIPVAPASKDKELLVEIPVRMYHSGRIDPGR